MKFIIIYFSILLPFITHGQSFFDEADNFFSTYVKQGLVDYRSIKEEPASLHNLVRQIADLDLSNKRVTPSFMKSFYINAYNILVIKQVVELYPIEGPLKVEGFFNSLRHEVMGQDLTLDQLEKEILYEKFPDPRLHFVLVCAAKGCPSLADFAYQPSTLEEQLAERTTKVLNSESFIQVNRSKVNVSEIFNWYQSDFGDILTFLNRYRDKQLSSETVIDYYTYDWSLNDINSK